MKKCCKEYSQAIQEGIIIDSPNCANISHHSEIDEGDGFIVDDSLSMEIKYCPFCGKKLEPDNERLF